MAAEHSQSDDSERAVGDFVLASEREQLRRSREYLRLMREDVLSLKAMGGDPLSEEFLKADLYHRAEALKDIPDAPLFFGRLTTPTSPRRSRTASRDTASTSAAGTCTPPTARPR